MEYLAVRNLAEFQHYKNRNPPWVKLHTKILADEHFRGLSIGARLLFLLLLAVAARTENHIPHDAHWIEIETGVASKVASKALAELLAERYLVCKHDACTRGREQRQSKASSTSVADRENGLPISNELVTARLIQAMGPMDERNLAKTRALCRRLPEGSIAKVTESVLANSPRDRIAYALSALTSEAA